MNRSRGRHHRYWINEGCDVIFSQPETGIFPKDATTSIAFDGAVNITETSGADLILLSTNLDALNSTEHAITFNNETWFNSFDNLYMVKYTSHSGYDLAECVRKFSCN